MVFFALFDKYVQESTSIRAIGTIKSYKVIRNKLIEYEHPRNVKLSIEGMNKKFL